MFRVCQSWRHLFYFEKCKPRPYLLPSPYCVLIFSLEGSKISYSSSKIWSGFWTQVSLLCYSVLFLFKSQTSDNNNQMGSLLLESAPRLCQKEDSGHSSLIHYQALFPGPHSSLVPLHAWLEKPLFFPVAHVHFSQVRPTPGVFFFFFFTLDSTIWYLLFDSCSISI